tara:strand:+ start:511 stop:1188 length:678 start_codon:yes stop_codon:yes gene_type:complete
MGLLYKYQIGGKIPKFQNGKTIYTSDKNDPRIQTYSDSLTVHSIVQRLLSDRDVIYDKRRAHDITYDESREEYKKWGDNPEVRHVDPSGTPSSKPMPWELGIKPEGFEQFAVRAEDGTHKETQMVPKHSAPVQPVVYKEADKKEEEIVPVVIPKVSKPLIKKKIDKVPDKGKEIKGEYIKRVKGAPGLTEYFHVDSTGRQRAISEEARKNKIYKELQVVETEYKK